MGNQLRNEGGLVRALRLRHDDHVEPVDPDAFTAIVKTVLADLDPPRLNDAEMAVFLEETTARLAAVYPRPKQRPLFGVRAVAAAYGLDPRWLARFVTNECLRGGRGRWSMLSRSPRYR
jgi:hypothetical protein